MNKRMGSYKYVVKNVTLEKMTSVSLSSVSVCASRFLHNHNLAHIENKSKHMIHS